jgi:hypothetical protein
MRPLGQYTKAFIAPPTPSADELHPKDVVPFGKYGAGRFTGHPIGLFIALGIVLMALIGVPESRLFLAAALPLGAIFGLVLWKLHEWKPSPLRRR